ncbi:MAG TPA: hypothetical protein GX702_15350 [Chloroflexi bacterium]|jgi:hypothetical protein|nr:hypothetical protein [Chloroflexota bacterium]
MLCPDCKRAVPGGTPCPQCGQPVPERESFEGQGKHYLRVLFLFSLILMVGYIAFSSRGIGIPAAWLRFTRSRWLWFYLLVFSIPTLIGIYYWLLLREEEIVITDEYIARTSFWGNERMNWADVREFHAKPVPFRKTRLGRITGLSRFLTQRKIFMRLPPRRYELIGPPDEQGNVVTFYLEPGTVGDMPWLLELIQEHIGPPQEG